jgi:cyclic pyranopterin phosphate synthase
LCNKTENNKPKTGYWLDNKLYINITNKCSNNCFFCFKRYRSGVGGFNLKLTEDPTLCQVESELGELLNMRNWDELVFCGFGEPTERLDVLLEVTRWTRQHYRRPMQIRVNTNGHGYVLNPDRNLAAELKEAGVTKISVSLNAGDRETYEEICRPTIPNAYETVIDFVQKTKSVLQVEVTAVRMQEVDVTKAKTVADKLGVKFRVREYVPCFY